MTGVVTDKLPGLMDSLGRKAGSIDAEIGQRIRRHRNRARLSQEELAARLSLSCQQLQKYESGANRISASRLVQLASALSVEISLFLRDDGDDRASTDRVLEPANDTANQPDCTEMLALMTAFSRITNRTSRTKVVEMATFLAGLELDPAKR